MYFDPGIGSLIVQVFISILAVGSGYLIATKTKIKDFFSRRKNNKTNVQNDEEL